MLGGGGLGIDSGTCVLGAGVAGAVDEGASYTIAPSLKLTLRSGRFCVGVKKADFGALASAGCCFDLLFAPLDCVACVGGGVGSSMRSLQPESMCLLMCASLTGLSQMGHATIGTELARSDV